MCRGREGRGSGRKRDEQGRDPDQQMGIYTHTMRNGFQVKKIKLRKFTKLDKKINYLKTNTQKFLPKGDNSLAPYESHENALLSSKALCLLNLMVQAQGCAILYQWKMEPCELESYLETISFPAFNYLHAELPKFAFAFLPNKFASFRLVLIYFTSSISKFPRVRPGVN